MSRTPRRRLVSATTLLTVLVALCFVPQASVRPAAAAPARAAALAPPATVGFEKVALDGGLSMGEPIELAVAPDGKVFYINRGTSSAGGQVRLYNPATRSTTVALTLALDARFEDGLIGITLHPGFASNRWVYLFYSPKVTPWSTESVGSPSTRPPCCSTRAARTCSSSGPPNATSAATRPAR